MTAFVSRTVGDIVAEMLMTRSAFAGCILVVEGEGDVKFWRPISTSPAKCQIIQAGGKQNVIGAVIAAERLVQRGILGVVDNDCDSLLGRSVPSPNIIRTESRDIETLMLCTPALERVLFELGDRDKIVALEASEGRNIREAFVSRALIFGQLRYLNYLNNWNISFVRLRPYKFVHYPSWNFDKLAILGEISMQTGISCQELDGHLAVLQSIEPDMLLHGKDCLDVLAAGLRGAIGNRQASQDAMLSMLRLAFHETLFATTSLYSQIKTWEGTNAPYQVLA